jgi:regulator of Ty1 transposition protein 103
LIKSLAAAESSVSASITARKALIADLERILEINKTALAKDEETYLTLDSRKVSTEAKKREVEDAIIRGLTSAEAASSSGGNGTSRGGGDPAAADFSTQAGFDNDAIPAATSTFLSGRPEIEEFTDDEGDYTITGSFDQDPDEDLKPPSLPVSAPISVPAPVPASPPPTRNPALAAALAEFSASGMPGLEQDYSAFLPGTTRTRTSSGSGTNGMSAKRRKTSHGAEDAMVPDLGEMGMEMDMKMGVEGFGLPGLGQPQQQEQAQRHGFGAGGLAGLHADVDELIKQEGGGM